jgi:mannose-6-phosphate isomerase-like protein (cupin superfamily)
MRELCFGRDLSGCSSFQCRLEILVEPLRDDVDLIVFELAEDGSGPVIFEGDHTIAGDAEQKPPDAEAGGAADRGGESGQDPPGDHDSGDPQPRADPLHDQVARQLENRVAPNDDAEEMFLVWRGRFRVEFRDRIVELAPGELLIVPCGVEHRTAADEEAEVILLEPAGVVNTGNVVHEKFTAPTGARI